jgi:HEPN domain-containing protein
MPHEAEIWLNYASENLNSAKVLHDAKLWNPSLNNSQQAVEKSLKAVLCSRSLIPPKTHSIEYLAHLWEKQGLARPLSEDEADLLDSVYMPSKYPLGSVLPNYQPDGRISQQCLALANQVFSHAKLYISPDANSRLRLNKTTSPIWINPDFDPSEPASEEDWPEEFR